MSTIPVFEVKGAPLEDSERIDRLEYQVETLAYLIAKYERAFGLLGDQCNSDTDGADLLRNA